MTSVAARARWAVSDTMLLTWRNLVHYVRVPQLIAFAVVQPIMFTLLFAYVFGGAIATANGNYVDYLIPGIVVQTVIFGSMQSGVNIAEDTQKGIMDRFRSLPIARGAVLAARTLSDTLRHLVSVLIMAGVGYLIGYRFHGTPLDALLALGVTLLMGLAFSWIACSIGLLVRDTQTAEIAGFTWVFPVVFASSIFVPVATMRNAPAAAAKGIAWFAERNPITHAADAVRALSLGTPVGDAAWQAALWCCAAHRGLRDAGSVEVPEAHLTRLGLSAGGCRPQAPATRRRDGRRRDALGIRRLVGRRSQGLGGRSPPPERHARQRALSGRPECPPPRVRGVVWYPSSFGSL